MFGTRQRFVWATTTGTPWHSLSSKRKLINTNNFLQRCSSKLWEYQMSFGLFHSSMMTMFLWTQVSPSYAFAKHVLVTPTLHHSCENQFVRAKKKQIGVQLGSLSLPSPNTQGFNVCFQDLTRSKNKRSSPSFNTRHVYTIIPCLFKAQHLLYHLFRLPSF